MDSGLTISKAGCRMMLEPGSMVYLKYDDRLMDVEDVRIFCWKWDMDAIRQGIDYFEKKWGMKTIVNISGVSVNITPVLRPSAD